MSLALLESAVNGSARPCAIAGCERHGSIAEARHHLRAPEWIWVCPFHQAAHERADTCRAEGCPARAVAWGYCGRHQAERRPAPASVLGAALQSGPPTQATAEDRDRILAILRASLRALSVSALQARIPELTRAQLRDALGELERAGLAQFGEGSWEAADEDDDPSSDFLQSPSNPPPIPPDPPAAEPAQEPPMAVDPTPDPTPDHLAPSDRRVLDLVRAQPGVAQAAVADLTGISGGTVAGCVRLLEGRGLIERRREAPTERPGYLGLALYPAGAPASPTPPAPPPKKAAEVRRDTLALIRAEPGILQARVGQRIGVNQSATSRALRELEAEGLIRREEIEIPREGGGGTRSLALYPVGQAASEPAPPPETRLPPLVRPRPEKLLATPPAESAALPDLRPISEYLEPPGIDSCPEQVPRLGRPPGPCPDCDGSDPEAERSATWKILEALGRPPAEFSLYDALGDIARLRETEAQARDALPEAWEEGSGRLRDARAVRDRLISNAAQEGLANAGSELARHMRTALDAHKILEAAKVPHGPLPERVGLLAERAEDLERQLREQSDDLAACGRALGCEDPTEGREVVRRAEAAAKVREELGVALRERTQERDAARAALGLAPGASLLDAIRSLREAGPPEPRWVETADGSWDLQVLRPVSVAEVDRVESGFEWICGEESGTARTLERAQRRAEQALADGEGA